MDDKKAHVYLLILTHEQMDKVKEYANYKGVPGGWQNLCRRLHSASMRVSSPPTESELTALRQGIDRVEKKQQGLFGPMDQEW